MPNTKRPLTVSDVIEFKHVQNAQISPDGSQVAFEISDRCKTDTKLIRSAIWLVSAHGGDARRLTFGPRADRQPRWSPDGRWLAFLSDRVEDGQLQLWLLPRAGGEASPLTSLRGEIEDFRWSGDGKRIYLLMTDPPTDEEKRKADARDDALEFEEHPKFARTHVLYLAAQSVTPLTSGDWHAWEFDATADGQRFAFVAADNPFEWSWYRSRLSLCAPGADRDILLYKSDRQLALPLISPDGAHVAFLSSTWSDRGVTAGDLWLVPTTGGAARNLTAGYGGSISWMTWRADGKALMFLALADLRSTFAEIDLDTDRLTPLWSGEVGLGNAHQQAFSVSADGSTLAVVRESATEPRDVWLARRAGGTLEWSRLTDLQPETAGFEPIAVESLRWKGADGAPIQGFLLTPASRQPGAPCPLVTVVHGGPTAAYTWAYPLSNRWIATLVSRGVAVLLPNPRGSTGWGLAFAEANVGDMGGKDFLDVMAGVDHCVAQGIADPDRLGIAGWSYGGYMTMWAVTQTDRFKAAMAGAGISHWRSFHGLTKYPTFDATFYRADPYENDRENPYELFSPITFVKRVKTPTLIVHGEKDADVPVAQAYEFHRALKEHGVETQLVVYPRERHGFTEKAHVLDLWQRVTEWFVKRLGVNA